MLRLISRQVRAIAIGAARHQRLQREEVFLVGQFAVALIAGHLRDVHLRTICAHHAAIVRRGKVGIGQSLFVSPLEQFAAKALRRLHAAQTIARQRMRRLALHAYNCIRHGLQYVDRLSRFQGAAYGSNDRFRHQWARSVVQ